MHAPPPETDWLDQWAYAHRGLHSGDVPENSLAAFEAAIESGLGIECDVHKSADGRAIVFHDHDLERLTGETGLLAQRGVAELTVMRLRASNQRIPTLRDTLDLVDGRVPILLELKTRSHRPVSPLCRAISRDCEGYFGKIAVMSFDPRVSRWFAARMPDMVRGLVVTEQGERTLWGAVKRRLSVRNARARFLAYDVRDLPSAFAARQRAKGRPLLTWTVKDAKTLASARSASAAPILEGAGVEAWREDP